MSTPRARVHTLLDLGRGAEAAVEASRLVARHPDDGEAMLLLARSYHATGQTEAAVEWASRAVAATPDDPRALAFLAEVQGDAGRVDEAVATARAAVALAPEDLSTTRALAISLAKTNDHDAAWVAAHRVVQLAPGDAGAHLTLGYTLHRWWPNHARAAYVECLRLDPTNAMARQNIAALDSSVSPFQAIDGFAAALAVDPTLDVARENIKTVVNKWTGMLFFIVLVSMQVFVRSDDEHPGVTMGVILLAGAAAAAVAVWRLPRGVRRSLRIMLLPGVAANRWAVRGFVLGLVVAIAGAVWLGTSEPTAQEPGMVVGLGAIVALVSLVSVIVSVRDAKRASRRL